MHWRWRWRAELYRAMASRFSAVEVDQMEFWQIGVYLQADLAPVSDWEPTAADLERAKRFAETPVEPGTDLTAEIMRAMGINTG